MRVAAVLTVTIGVVSLVVFGMFLLGSRSESPAGSDPPDSGSRREEPEKSEPGKERTGIEHPVRERTALNVITGTEDFDRLDGGKGDDLIRGLGDVDHISGGGGDDVLEGGRGDDDINGAGMECDGDMCGVTRERGADVLRGGPGRDELYGDPGPDVLYGGPGNDYLYDSGDATGVNKLYGGDGDDSFHTVYKGPPVRDIVVCGPGRDRVEADYKDKVSADCEEVKRLRPEEYDL